MSGSIWDPNSTYRPYGEAGDESLSEDLPQDLRDFFAEHKVEKNFSLCVKKFAREDYSGKPRTLGNYADEIPMYETLVAQDGPGYYRFDISYKPKHGVFKKEKVDINLTGYRWSKIFEEQQDKDEIEKEERLVKKVSKNNIISAMGGTTGTHVDPYEAGQKYVNNMLGVMAPFMEKMGGGGSDQMMPMMIMMMQQQQKSSENMMQMFMMMNQSQVQMMASMMGNKPKEGEQFNTHMEMFKSMINLKSVLEPKEESMIQRIGNTIMDNVETLFSVLSKPKEQMEEDGMYKSIVKNKKFQAAKEKAIVSKPFLLKLVKHLDTRVGIDMTDKILNGFVKVDRPEEAKDEAYQEAKAAQAAGDESDDDDQDDTEE